MICRKVVYRNFRNLEEAELIPSEGVTVLNGENGQGKTNTLEGIFVFAGGRSFRTLHESELVRFGAPFSEISMTYFDGKRDCVMSLKWIPESGKRICKKNGVFLTKLSEVVGNFRAVLFCPEHLSLVKDGPAVRRRFLDTAISQIDPLYLKVLQLYSRLLAQRNALIRLSREKHDDSIFLSQAEIWSERLAKEAALLSEKRSVYVEKLNALVSSLLSDMTCGKESASLSYTSYKTEEEYFKLLTSNTERELKFGTTLYGIHKDDIKIEHCGKEARAFASQGQQRSLALAMKLAEGEISKEKDGEYPVFLFDDILSELDFGRREYLLHGISGRQVIITSCEKISTKAKLYFVRGGKLSAAE